MNLEKELENRKQKFIQYCLDHEDKIPNSLPMISQGKKLEAVLIEFRVIIHLGFVIKNAVLKLGSSWSITIVCGEDNYFFIQKIKEDLKRDIRIIKVPHHNLTREQYSVMLMKSSFYKQFQGDKLLFMQEDSLIFKSLPSKYLAYDYVGAPFANRNVGNGGLSLRDREIMIKICATYFDKHNYQREKYAQILKNLKPKIQNKYGKKYFNNSNLYYIYQLELELIEDYNICKIMREKKIGKLPDWRLATEFSIEKYYHDDSFGSHQPWFCISNIYNWLVHKLQY